MQTLPLRGRKESSLSTIVIALGRYGDIINVLPCVQRIAQSEGGKCAVMVSEPFADVLEGCSYVDPVVVPFHFTDRDTALVQAREMNFDNVLVCNTNERAMGVTTQCESFTQEAWRQLGMLELYHTLPLVFDRRDRERELRLFERVTKQFNISPEYPYGCFNFTGKSAPLKGGEAWLERNAMWLERSCVCEPYGLKWIDLGQVKAERIYDLLILLDRAEWLVTCDTATLHLAAASRVPCVNFLNSKPHRWHGSRPRNNSILEMRYDEIHDLTEPLDMQQQLVTPHFMTGYHIETGYNSVHSKEEVGEKLREVVKAICAKPETITAEVKRVEGRDIPARYAESYREPWQDATIKIIEGDRLQVMQLASGSGESRDYKEAMRRAFCRMVLEAMHREQMEVSVVVA